MAFVGKISLSSLMGIKVADVDMDGMVQKCLLIPIKANDIINYKGEWQLWFRVFAYRHPKSRFSHFIMKFIPQKDIKRLSAAQIEAFANRSIGGMIKTDKVSDTADAEIETEDFIKNNI